MKQSIIRISITLFLYICLLIMKHFTDFESTVFMGISLIFGTIAIKFKED